MIRTMHIATNTLGQLQQHIDVIGSNIANIDTNGYKSQKANFREMLYQQYHNDRLDRAPRESALGIRYGVGAKLNQIKTNEATGPLQTTNRSLDFTLKNPHHYFAVRPEKQQNGSLPREKNIYTRKGDFYLSPNENDTLTIVDKEGRALLDSYGNDMTVRKGIRQIKLSTDGELIVTYDDHTTDILKFSIYEINRPNIFQRLPDGSLTLPKKLLEYNILPNNVLRQAAQGEFQLEQGVLERSNVRLEEELTDLLSTQRLYQMNARTVTLADQMLGIVNNIR